MIAVVLKGWPRLSETFIARELQALQARGLALSLWSLRHPTDRKRHPAHDAVTAPVTYLPEYLHHEPARVWRAWRKLRRTPAYAKAWALFRVDWKRDRTRNRIRRFGQALVLAAELPPDAWLLYAHFIHTPGSVARYAAALRGLPFAVSAHARDIWTSPDWDLAGKLSTAAFVTTCTADGHARLAAITAATERLHLNRHGLDLAAWPPPPERAAKDGSDPANPVIILSVGRAVEKKGYDTLLDALAMLPPGLHWRFAHIGGGALTGALQVRAAELGLHARIAWMGAQSEDFVRTAMRESDLFVLTPRVAADGDRDGLPNVLVEAQSQALPVVATRVGGVGELVIDGTNGLLCPPGDAPAIATALVRLIREPETRAMLGGAGCDRIASAFTAAPGIDAIAGLLRQAMAPP
jgi:glycosyltransferase involved in cell wall biosynthesis